MPLACNWPIICDAPPPRIWFNTCSVELPCRNSTFSPAAMLKPDQSITARWDVWVTSISLGDLTTIWAWPEITLPCCGNARAGDAATTAHKAVQVSNAARVLPTRNPRHEHLLILCVYKHI